MNPQNTNNSDRLPSQTFVIVSLWLIGGVIAGIMLLFAFLGEAAAYVGLVFIPVILAAWVMAFVDIFILGRYLIAGVIRGTLRRKPGLLALLILVILVSGIAYILANSWFKL